MLETRGYALTALYEHHSLTLVIPVIAGVPSCEVGTTMPTQNRLINHFLEARDREPRVLTQ